MRERLRDQDVWNKPSRSNEAGFVTPKAALRIGAGLLALSIPISAYAAGTGATRPPIMEGTIEDVPDLKEEVVFRDFDAKQELCLGDGTMDITAGKQLIGLPGGGNLDTTQYVPKDWPEPVKAAANTLLPNFNYEKKLIADNVTRIVKFCINLEDIHYEFDPNVPFKRHAQTESGTGNTAEVAKPSITVYIDALDNEGNSSIHTYVMNDDDPTNDIYHESYAGYATDWIDDAGRKLENENVQNLIGGADVAQGMNASEKLDNLLRGVLDVKIDRLAATACVAAGNEYDWMQPTIKKLIIQSIKEAVKDNFREDGTLRDKPQPDDADIEVIIGKPTLNILTDATVQQKERVADAALDSVKNGEYKITIELPEIPLIGKYSFDIPININPHDVGDKPVTCTISPEVAAQAASTGER